MGMAAHALSAVCSPTFPGLNAPLCPLPFFPPRQELKAYMASRGKKVGEGEKLDAKAINQVGAGAVGGVV